MTEYEALLNLIDDLKDNKKIIETLTSITYLLGEIGTGRFTTAEYTRAFKHDRLSIIVAMNKTDDYYV